MSRDPIGFSGGLNLFSYANNNGSTFIDPEGLNPLSWFLQTKKGWKLLGTGNGGKQAAARAMRQEPYGVNLLLEGGSKTGRQSEAFDLGKKVFGKKNTTTHKPHPEMPASFSDHVQPIRRQKCPTNVGWNQGHIYFSGGILVPGAALGTDLLGDNLAGATADLMNPIGTVQFAVDILNGPTQRAGLALGAAFQKNESAIQSSVARAIVEAGYFFNLDLRPGIMPWD